MVLKSEKEIAVMREGGKILSEIMERLEDKVSPGVTTAFLDSYAEKIIKEKKGKPSFKGYRNFPAALCASVNEVIVHGTPSDDALKEGDILSLDLGFFYKGFHTDMAVTIPVGKVDGETRRLIRETKKALKRGIKQVKKGSTLGDVGNTISRHVKRSGFFVIEGLCGHGIGREIHEEPQILNEGKRHKGIPIETGMVFCIEPMLSVGGREIKEGSDGTGIQTADGSLSAHFEHTVAVTEKGCVVLTQGRKE